jgi:ABC-type dipeptide/oligopeptide/nickel transport system ATPase subunit
MFLPFHWFTHAIQRYAKPNIIAVEKVDMLYGCWYNSLNKTCQIRKIVQQTMARLNQNERPRAIEMVEYMLRCVDVAANFSI